MLYQFDGKVPVIHDDCYIAPSADVIGDIILESGVSIWFNAVLRGDCDCIIVGKNSNIQDASVLHTDQGLPLRIGEGVTVAHKVMLHGCTIGDHSLIGMNAVVLNGAKIGNYCIVGANTLVTEGMEIPDYSLVMGSPGRIIKQLPQSVCEQLEDSAAHYVQTAKTFSSRLQPLV